METGQAETQPLNPAEAIAALSSQIQEAEAKAETPRDDQGKFAKKEAPQAEAKAEDAKPEEEAPAAEEEAAQETQTEAEAKQEAKEARRLRLKYKGEEREVDEAEAIELAQKGFDYTQKSQALAKEREEHAAKVKAEIEQARAAYLQQLEIQKQAVQKLSGAKSMQEIELLAKTDPAAAQEAFLRKLSIDQQLQAIEAEQAKVFQQRQQEAQEAMRKQASEAVERLQERIPAWSNDLYTKILDEAVKTYGFQKAEVNAITDHRAIEVLHDAMKWREYQAAKPKTMEKRVAAVPKVQKPGTAAEKTDPKAKRTQDLMAKFQKTGTRDDAVALMTEAILQGRA